MRTSKDEIIQMMRMYLPCDENSQNGIKIKKFVNEWKWVNGVS